jgi:LacI family gluconate utilization system Gnt-I transcriptional repressor
MNEGTYPRRSRGTDRARIEDVARLAGVSTQTVSRYFREPTRVADDTRRRIRQAVKEAGYVRNLIAGSLASNRTDVIGIIVPTISNPAHAAPVQGLSDAVRSGGYQVLLGSTGYDGFLEAGLVEAFLGRRLDGLVITGAAHRPTVRKLLRNANMPVVELWEIPKRPIDMAVGFSNAAGGAAIAQHFFERGRRRLAVIAHSAKTDTRSAARVRGFRETAARLGLRDPEVFTFSGLPSMGFGSEALGRVLTTSPDVDAIFAVSYLVASGIILECRHRALDVPGDIAVAGFGDSELAGMMEPRLTTIRIRGYELGKIAGEMLMARLRGEPFESSTVDIGFELVVRETT